MNHYDSVVADAKKLSLDERLKLIDELTLEIPDDAYPTVSEDSVEEFDRRVLEMRNGTVETVPWEAVLTEMDEKLGTRRAD